MFNEIRFRCHEKTVEDCVVDDQPLGTGSGVCNGFLWVGRYVKKTGVIFGGPWWWQLKLWFYFHIYLGKVDWIWLIFFREVDTTNQVFLYGKKGDGVQQVDKKVGIMLRRVAQLSDILWKVSCKCKDEDRRSRFFSLWWWMIPLLLGTAFNLLDLWLSSTDGGCVSTSFTLNGWISRRLNVSKLRIALMANVTLGHNHLHNFADIECPEPIPRSFQVSFKVNVLTCFQAML